MTVSIEPLHLGDVEAAKDVIRQVCLEVFGTEPVNFEDMDQVSIQYVPPSGTFLVLRDGDSIVGTGAIRRLDERVCELKRLWFLPAYRGRGLGQMMAERLLEFARTAGYERVRLDTSLQLKAANRLFGRLGFRPIDRYNNGPGTVFLEKDLRQAHHAV
ncbi:MAG: GNAT family N-acetyltransferase [Vicinamibacterales bacterium]